MKDKAKNAVKAFVPSRLRPKLKTAHKKVRYFGFRYQCPFCKSRLRKFLPYGFIFPVLKEKKVIGGGYRLNTLCPVCDSLDRERLLYLFLLHKTNIFGSSCKVLHVAPEKRVETVLNSKKNIDYLTADLLKPNVMVTMDITNIDFPDNTFDAIVCNHVLEHIIDDHKAMAELYRVLKPGGWAVLQVPISLILDKTYEDFSITLSHEREIAFGQDDHVRIYAKDYRDRLTNAGFEIDVFGWPAEAKNFGGTRNIFGLNEDECVYMARKPEKPY